MSIVIDETVIKIDRTLDAAKAEIAKLEGARRALAGPPRRTTKARPRGDRRRRVATVVRGQRRAQFLEAVEQKPGITTAEVAEMLQVRRDNAARVAKGLVKDRRIHGNHAAGWYPQLKARGHV